MLRLQLIRLSKTYPAIKACHEVSLSVAPGEIHAVLGENGAGKSTLMKMIYGAVRPDDVAGSEIRWNGRAVQIYNPQQARSLGISMVFQHFSLFDTLTVAENVWLGVDKSLKLQDVTQRIRDTAERYGLPLDPRRPVHTLSVGERQRVEIVRALMTQPQLLILDEPTSVLTPAAVETLFQTLRQLADGGCSLLYISHKLDEIRALCHRCTVLRGGRVTGEVDPARESNASLSRLMIGAEPPALSRPAAVQRPADGTPVLEVSGLGLESIDSFGTPLRQVTLEVHGGEIVGVAGVSGNGQQELTAALSGEDMRAAPTAIRLFGKPVARLSPVQRRRLGLHSVPEERLGRGAVPSLSLAQNTLLTRTASVGPGGWIRGQQVTALARRLIERFGVKTGGPGSAAQSLSGGNLQKFIVGREIDARPQVLIVSQPTWGVDVGAATQIRQELLRLRDAGCAVLVVSEELDELFQLSDRLVVMARGRLSPGIATDEASVEQIGAWMSGLWDEPADAVSAKPEAPHAAA